MISIACPSSEARIHEVSSLVPSYLVQRTKYRSLQRRRRLSIFESRISEILNSSSPSISTGGGGGWTRFGMVFGVATLSWETWKTGCTARMVCGRRRVKDWGPTLEMISKGPRYFSESFFDGRVDRKNSART